MEEWIERYWKEVGLIAISLSVLILAFPVRKRIKR